MNMVETSNSSGSQSVKHAKFFTISEALQKCWSSSPTVTLECRGLYEFSRMSWTWWTAIILVASQASISASSSFYERASLGFSNSEHRTRPWSWRWGMSTVMRILWFSVLCDQVHSAEEEFVGRRKRMRGTESYILRLLFFKHRYPPPSLIVF